jgi:hypothetical protein
VPLWCPLFGRIAPHRHRGNKIRTTVFRFLKETTIEDHRR